MTYGEVGDGRIHKEYRPAAAPASLMVRFMRDDDANEDEMLLEDTPEQPEDDESKNA